MHAPDSRERQHPRLAHINALTASVWGVTPAELASGQTDKILVRARWMAMWLAAGLTQMSQTQIGRPLGRRDHSTIQHGLRRACALSADPCSAFAVLAAGLRNALLEDTTTMNDEQTAHTLRGITAALRDRRLSTLERLVLAELHARAGGGSIVTTSASVIAAALDVHPRSVLTCLRELAALRIIDDTVADECGDDTRELTVHLRAHGEDRS